MNEDSFRLIDFTLDKWDYWTLLFGLIAIVAFFYVLIQIGGLPGKIAERRNHPHAEAVKYVGWIGLFTVFPYIHALIWAIHDSVTVDVRKMPEGSSWASIDAPPPELPGTGADEEAGKPGPETARTEVVLEKGGTPETPAKQGQRTRRMFIAIAFVVIYVVFVWLVFFKFRLMKFTIVWGVVGFWVGVHLMLIFIVALRFYQPYSMDAHIIRPTIQLLPRLPEPTLLTQVLVESNEPVKAGDPLYQFDQSIYQAKVAQAQANLAQARQNVSMLEQDLTLANEQLDQAKAQQVYTQQQYDRYSDLVPKGGARQETLDKWTADLASANAAVIEAEANVQKAQLALDSKVDGVNSQIVAAQAGLDQAQYFLEQTTLRAPEDGVIINQQARPGLVVGIIRLGALAVLVADADPYLLATFYQEHLKFVEPGQKAEIALDIYPGRIFNGYVEKVWWGTGQGQIKPSGNVPTFRFPSLQGRIAVQIKIDDPDLERMPAGVHGAVAIYTGGGKNFEPLRRINIRLYSWGNFLFPMDFL